MRITVKNVGPINNADIELGDFTLFFGFPSTGKSYALRSIYSSLALLDEYVISKIRREILPTLTKVGAVGMDYTLGYLFYLFSTGYNICDQDGLKRIIDKVNATVNSNVQLLSVLPSDRECVIKLSEVTNLNNKINEISTRVSEEIINVVLKNVRNSIGYEDNSSIIIDGEELKDFIKKVIKPSFTIISNTSDFELVSLASIGGLFEGRGRINRVETKVEITVDLSIRGFNQKALKKVTENGLNASKDILAGLLSFSLSNPLSSYYPIIFNILDKNILHKTLIKNVLQEYTSLLFIPYGRSESLLIYNSMNKREREMRKLGIITTSSMEEVEWAHDSFIYNFENALDRISDNMINTDYIRTIMMELYKMGKIANIRINKFGEYREISYEIDNGRTVQPYNVSAMINEVTSIFLPLLAVETPSLVLIEEPESELHPAYQILLGLSLLSLVQQGYKFVISTHSDMFAAVLGSLIKFKPNRDRILELLKGIFGDNLPKVFDTVAEYVEKIIKENKIKVYYFTEGTVKEVDASTINFKVPGITQQVIDKVVEWELRLSGYE
ncbi:AAA family ATPase [Acidianus sulfidivorans JP7]|uniref:Endonuclease GajA/Old nuclease/RecF-like AAA domain-containing protein n=1 Tax=Acidianus sulfidivorans JP7 TaxID=619593 RepID=A0A2U9IJY6_9CREN|nr:AAA family ATPase [Acidianus sulfidivorans]AWR96234.1 AAA family ATPase [Acidianus sulfidivorans JP7]